MEEYSRYCRDCNATHFQTSLGENYSRCRSCNSGNTQTVKLAHNIEGVFGRRELHSGDLLCLNCVPTCEVVPLTDVENEHQGECSCCGLFIRSPILCDHKKWEVRTRKYPKLHPQQIRTCEGCGRRETRLYMRGKWTPWLH